MLYKEPTEQLGLIDIDGDVYPFSVYKVNRQWAVIRIHEEGKIISVHNVPIDMDIYQKVKTGGHVYRLISPYHAPKPISFELF